MSGVFKAAILVVAVFLLWWVWPLVASVFVASSLSDFRGRTGTVYLVSSPSDQPHGSVGDGVKVVNGVLVSVSGKVTWASSRGLVISWGNRETWVPAEAIAAASFLVEVPDGWGPGGGLD